MAMPMLLGAYLVDLYVYIHWHQQMLKSCGWPLFSYFQFQLMFAAFDVQPVEFINSISVGKFVKVPVIMAYDA